MSIRFDERVVIVTGGGNGLGREHCLQFAGRGANVVVNDLGGAVDGSGASDSSAERVAEEIRSLGGRAIANSADITDAEQVDAMVAEAKAKWGRVDVLVNNAGILRDKTFAKMDMADFKKVVDVHLFGSANCAKSVWQTMRDQAYGRIVFTSSSSGIFGNFGQSNYGAAKAAVIGLMNVLHIEGAKHNIRVNALAPAAATRMVDGLISSEVGELLSPAAVSPAVLFLASENAPSKTIVGAGAGCFTAIRTYETPGAFVGTEGITVDDFAANWAQISARDGEAELDAAFMQTQKFVDLAAREIGIELKEEI